MKLYDIVFILLLCATLFFVDINKQFLQGVATAAVAAWYIFRRMAGKC